MVWKAANCLAHTELLFAFGRYSECSCWEDCCNSYTNAHVA